MIPEAGDALVVAAGTVGAAADAIGERFRVLADHVPAMLWLSDATGARTFYNARWLDFTGRSPAEELGEGWLESVHPEDREALWAAYQSAVAERRESEHEYRFRRHDGVYRWVLARWVPTPPGPDGTPPGMIGAVLDVSDRREIELARAALLIQANAANARLAQLQDLTARLARLDDLQQIADLIVQVGLEDFDGGSVSLMLLNEEETELEVVAWAGYAEDTMARWRTFPLAVPTPARDAIQSGEGIYLHDTDEARRLYPVFAESMIASKGAVAVLPLITEERRLGAISLGLGLLGSGDMDGVGLGERRLLEALAAQVAIALSRTRDRKLLEAARTESERRGAQLVFLADATAKLAATLDLEMTLATIAELAVPRVTDACSVHLIASRGLDTVLLSPARPTPTVQDLLEHHPAGDDASSRVRRAVDLGEETYVAELTEEALDASGLSAERRRAIARLGLGGILVTPLRARGRIIGAIAFTNRKGRLMTEPDRLLALELAARAAVALDNSLLFQRESQIARRLQSSLLPTRLPEVAGLELAARYAPATEDLEVGGDFYDCIELADGRVLLVVGDVRGKGIEAAAATGLARHTIRSAALYDPRPAAVIRHLNDVLLDNERSFDESGWIPDADGDDEGLLAGFARPEPRFCTAVVVLLERSGSEWSAEVCCGGHPLPLVRRADGAVEPIGRPGNLVGVDRDIELRPTSVVLEAGSTLVLFTDGVSETHRGANFFGEEGIAATLATATGGAAEITGEIEAAARDFLGGERAKDDMVLLALKVLPPD